MIKLTLADKGQLEKFDRMDRLPHAIRFVFQIGLEGHLRNFQDPNVRYLNIENEIGNFLGYFILAHEPEYDSVEFRRILLDPDARGVGQQAIAAMEAYCLIQYETKRIWLDVYQDNEIGIHIYQKLGYQRFDKSMHNGRELWFYQKLF